MTFVVGFKCSDGIVLCADRLDTNGVTKRHRCKIEAMSINSEWGVCWASSGFSDVIDKFSDKLKALLNQLSEFKQEDIEHAAESALAYISQNQPDNVIEILLGVWCAPLLGESTSRIAKSILYRGRSDVCSLAVENDYGMCGRDVTLAEFILRNLFRHRRTSVDEGIRLGIFATAMMKEYAEGVGGPTDVVTHRLRENDWHSPLPEVISSIESTFNVREFERALVDWWENKREI
jgi:20S proteasome alpha/beta subunit